MSMRQHLFNRSIILTVIACLGLAAPGWAQEIESGESVPDVSMGTVPDPADDRVEEITVTTNRREENIQDVAVSVTALSGSFLEETGTTDFAAVQKFTPNLQILPSTDTRATSIRIRGIGSVGSNAGIDPSVAIFIDGIYQGRAGMSVNDLLDIQGIEVLRGPQGTLYGKNTAAGAITVTSKRPTYEPSGNLEFVIGDYRDYEARFAVNLPILDDRVATRLAGYGVIRDGYDINTFKDEDVNGAAKWGLRSRTLWDVNERLEVLFTLDWAQRNDSCCVSDIQEYGAPLTDPDQNELLPSARVLEQSFGVTLPEEDPADREVSVDLSPTNKVQVGGAAVEVNYDWGEHTLTSLSAYRHYGNDSNFDGDFSLLDATAWVTSVELHQASTELRLVSPGSELIQYQAGLYFFYMHMDTDDSLSWSEEYMLNAFGTAEKQFNIGENTHETINAAAFGDTTLGISEYFGWAHRVELTGGVRLGWERKDRVGSQVAEGPLPIFLETPLSGPPQFSDIDRSVTGVTGRAMLSYKPTDDVMLYASFASGLKSGGFNQLRTSGAATDDTATEFDDEKSMSYEAGIRTTWFERMLTVNATGFYTNYDDFQAQVFDGLGIRVINAGRFISYGFESELTLVPLPGWINSLSVGYTKTEYKSFDRGPCTGIDTRRRTAAPPLPPAALPNCQFNGDAGAFVQDLKGRPLDNAPEWSISLFSAYEHEIPGMDVNWFVNTDYQYIDERFLNASLDPDLLAAGINLWGLRTGFRHPESSWELLFWVQNLLDETFYVAGFDVPTMGGTAVILGPPRTLGGTIRLKF